jgi:hypothetical protein
MHFHFRLNYLRIQSDYYFIFIGSLMIDFPIVDSQIFVIIHLIYF